ncbi:MAG: YicC family protein [Bryobacterales bacterium]|nr:YicC family protein [Bryobacterales bacterium]
MTGYARVRKPTSDGEVVVTIKSVNHRGLDLHFHLAPELDPFEPALRSLVKERVKRGHLQIQVSFLRAGGCIRAALNRPLLEAYLHAFEQARAEFNLDSRPDLNAALRVPDMFRAETVDLDADFEQMLCQVMDEALETLNAFRAREGREIAAELKTRSAAVRRQAAEMEQIRGQATAAFQRRLKQRLGELLRGAGADPQRLAQEAALLAERSDISEELARLKTHAAELEELLKAGGEVGKKLDFLLQEMNRESNTVLSKTSGLAEIGLKITELALAAKAEIDKIREQALNLE